MFFNQLATLTAVETGDWVKIWPFVVMGISIVILVLLFTLPKKNQDDDDDDE